MSDVAYSRKFSCGCHKRRQYRIYIAFETKLLLEHTIRIHPAIKIAFIYKGAIIVYLILTFLLSYFEKNSSCQWLCGLAYVAAGPILGDPGVVRRSGEKAGRKLSITGEKAPGYRPSPNYFQKFKRMPPPDWAQKMLCIIMPNR